MTGAAWRWVVERDGSTTFPGHTMRITSVVGGAFGTLDVAYEIVPALTDGEQAALLPLGFVTEGIDAAGDKYIDMGGAFGPEDGVTAGTVSVQAPRAGSTVTLSIVRSRRAELLEDAPDWRLRACR